MKKILHTIRIGVETLWEVFKLLWNLPLAIIELIWLAFFDKDKFYNSVVLLKETIKGKKNGN